MHILPSPCARQTMTVASRDGKSCCADQAAAQCLHLQRFQDTLMPLLITCQSLRALRCRHLEPQQLHGNTAYRIVSHSPANDEPRCLTAAADTGGAATEDGGVELAPCDPARQQQLWLLILAAGSCSDSTDAASGTATTDTSTPCDHASRSAAAGLYHICAVARPGRQYLTRLPGQGGNAGRLGLCGKADGGTSQVGVATHTTHREACGRSLQSTM